MPDFHSVVEFRYLYVVDLIEAKTLFCRGKRDVIIFDNEKKTKKKLNRKDTVFIEI